MSSRREFRIFGDRSAEALLDVLRARPRISVTKLITRSGCVKRPQGVPSSIKPERPNFLPRVLYWIVGRRGHGWTAELFSRSILSFWLGARYHSFRWRWWSCSCSCAVSAHLELAMRSAHSDNLTIVQSKEESNGSRWGARMGKCRNGMKISLSKHSVI